MMKMKKTLCLILAVFILMSAFSLGFSAFAEFGTLYSVATDDYTDAYCNGCAVTQACAHDRITPSFRSDFGTFPADKYLTGEFEVTTADGTTIGLADDGSFPMPEQDVSIKAVIADKTTLTITLKDTKGKTVPEQIAAYLAKSEWSVPGGSADNCGLDFNRDNKADAKLTGAENASGETVYTLALTKPASDALEGEYKADLSGRGCFFPYKGLVVKILDGTTAAAIKIPKTDYTGICGIKLVIKATILNKIGEPIANRALTLQFNGATYTQKSDKNGVVNVNIPTIKPGTFKCKLICDDVSETIKITIKTRINIKLVTPKQLAVGSNNAFVRISFYDNYKKLRYSDKTVKLKINGKTYTIKTDGSGYAKLSLKSLRKGTYKLKITTPAGTTKTEKIQIGVHSTVITAENKTFKASAKTKKFTATLKDKINDLVIKNCKVNFKIAGRNYTVRTDTQGKASLKLTNLEKGTYTLKIVFNKVSAYKGSSRTVKITIK